MNFDLPGSGGYLLLSQLWEGDFTLKGVGDEAAQKLAGEVARRHGGTLDTRHANWVIPCRRGLALFEELDKVRGGDQPVKDVIGDPPEYPAGGKCEAISVVRQS